ncbi:MAG: GerMN domain-containing protein [Spirochaetales bacterium]|nr:GerMN domain-containing protein [Spirochaetales bacterium]
MAKRKKASLGCLFWIALILLVAVVFLLNQQNIQAVLKDTGFLTLFQSQDENPEDKVTIVYNTDSGDNQDNTKTDVRTGGDEVTVRLDDDTQAEEPEQEQEQEKPEEKPAVNNEKPHIRKAKLYFVTMTENDEFELKSVTRSVNFKDSPLTETLFSLLSGPTDNEFNDEIMNLIPRQTRINNIYIKNNTAYIDFNEEFRFNSLGVFGLTAQLKQVIYTVTEFSNVSQVQILINGKTVNYLAQEGVFIGKPLSRNSFN